MDEPTSALDVVAQRSLMGKIKELQSRIGFAVIFVTHDMSLVGNYSDRVMVMYAGQVAEAGTTEELFDRPLHPYSQGLMDAFPSIRGPRRELTGIPGRPPDLLRPPAGCRFQPRCSQAMAICTSPTSTRSETRTCAASCTPTSRPPMQPEQPDAAGQVSNGAAPAGAPLLRTVGLTRHFRLGGLFSKRVLHAVDDFDMTIGEREIVAVVGESGSGKTTVARLLALVYRPTRGQIYYRERPLQGMRSRRKLQWYRGEVAMVFQDPFSAFNPVFRISHGIMRNLALHRPDLKHGQRRQEAERVCEAVGLNAEMLRKFPYEMSGGERQRIGFAQALAVSPKLILADEPVSMLDVSIRAGVLNLMGNLRDQEGVSILYITHDIASARYVADRIIVMYAGHLVESGPAETILGDPRHPYTQLLLSAVSDPRDRAAPVPADSGEPPKVINPSEGCRFRWRCPLAIEKCSHVTPRPSPLGAGHEVACHVAVGDIDDVPSSAEPALNGTAAAPALGAEGSRLNN
jgi:peptide/nickel transport system ATP-binding protein